jgi:hypothetical protein
MANPQHGFSASENIRECRFVVISGNHTLAEGDANERTVGITYQSSKFPPLNDLVATNYHAQSGDQCQIYGLGDVCLLQLGGTVTAGDLLKSDNDGQGVAIATSGTTIQQIGARALEGGSSGERRLVQIVQFSERPALA